MNYYRRHIGDYAKDAGHLSMLEHGAYTLLMDRYYATEKGIPADQIYRIARARTPEERQAVDVVLQEFFTLEGDAWTNGRCEEEIEEAHTRAATSRENGKLSGGRPKGSKNKPKPNPEETQEKPGGFPVGSETETQGEPEKKLPTTQYPLDKNKNPPIERVQNLPSIHANEVAPEARAPSGGGWGDAWADGVETPQFVEFKLAMPDRAGSHNWHTALVHWNQRTREGVTAETMIAGAKRYAAYCDATEATGTQHVKAASTFLGPERHYADEWTPPKTKGERRQDRNVTALQNFVKKGSADA